jgi:hypothetical protein
MEKREQSRVLASVEKPIVLVNVAEFRFHTTAIVFGTFTLAKSVPWCTNGSQSVIATLGFFLSNHHRITF